MNAEKQQQLAALLKEYDTAGLSFHDAKQKILAQGFDEAELIHALYSTPYDGKPDQPQPIDTVRQYYEHHPEKADQVAKSLILDQAEKDWNSTVAHGIAGQVMPGPRGNHHEVKMSDSLGIPYFRMMAAILIIGGLMVVARFTVEEVRTVLNAVALIALLAAVWLLVRKRRHINQLRRDVRLHKRQD